MPDALEPFSWIARLSQLGTAMQTYFLGRKVGADCFGNTYYRERGKVEGRREKRWVMYKGRPEASLIPPEWHGWLHYTHDEPLPEESEFHKAWVKPHQPNLTFTAEAYAPRAPGAPRARSGGDYEAWSPSGHKS